VLTQEPLAVDAKTGGAPPPVASGTPAASQSASPALPAAPAATPDITAMAGGSASWSSLFFRKEFLIANASLAVAWLAICLIMALRKFASSRAGRELARKKLVRDAFASLKDADPAGFYEKARDYIYLRLNAGADDLAVAAKIDSSSLSPEFKASLYRVLERHGQTKYAAGGAPPPSAEERQAAITILKELEAGYEK
jgi:hypothetical protein